jgi:AcrR family transcriptional regulator
MGSVEKLEKPRRTQAERRAATRAALLDAALACLIEDGYANLTTRRVAERAGVSQGAQQHYFASKSEFVAEAMRYAVRQITDEVLRRIDLQDLGNPERRAAMLDEIWRIHQSPAFKASLELWVASRSDAELRTHMRELEREITGFIGGVARTATQLEELDPEKLEILDMLLATVRGYAMLVPVVPQAELNRRWARSREHLLEMLG